MKTFTVTQDTTLKQFTDCTYPQGSFCLSTLLRRGDVRVNGIKTHKDCRLKAGDSVAYYTTPAQEQKPTHTVIYADQFVLIADKFQGVSSEGLFSELREEAAYPVHRLDRNTCGLIVIAKSRSAQEELVEAFKERAVEKVYLCLAKNNFINGEASLCAYLHKDDSGKVSIYDRPGEGRVKILTDYKVEKSFGEVALVKVILHTGKTHQIRAHLAHVGCPVLGDTKYGDFPLNKKYSLTRQQLVAKSLKFNLSGNLKHLNGKTFTSNFFPQLPKN